jgi:hypothetical protein
MVTLIAQIQLGWKYNFGKFSQKPSLDSCSRILLYET